ncbi:MAG: ABC transporter ATP-binding protein [Alkalispirochaeta sp.]
MADVELKDVAVTLGDPPRRIIDTVSLRCLSGTITLVVGANGSGKSVLLRTILSLVQPSAGSVFFDGADVRRKPRILHAVTGVCFQNPDLQIFGDTVAEDVALALTTGTPNAEEDTAGHCDKLVAEFGLEGHEGDAPWTLSGGQRRRLALAGALAGPPKVLILDEPFLELDYPSVRRLVATLRAFRDSGGTVILASHETRDIWHLVDQAVVMYEGRALYTGPPEGAQPFVVPDYGLRPIAAEDA